MAATYADFTAAINKDIVSTIMETEVADAWPQFVLSAQPMAKGETDIPVDTEELEFGFEDEDNLLPFSDWTLGKITLNAKRRGLQTLVRKVQIAQASVAPLAFLQNKIARGFWRHAGQVLGSGTQARAKYGYPSVNEGATEAGKVAHADTVGELALATQQKLEETGVFTTTHFVVAGGSSEVVNYGTSYNQAIYTDNAGVKTLWNIPVMFVKAGTFGAGVKVVAFDANFFKYGVSGNTEVIVDDRATIVEPGTHRPRSALSEKAVAIVGDTFDAFALWGPQDEDDKYTDFPAAIGYLGAASS